MKEDKTGIIKVERLGDAGLKMDQYAKHLSEMKVDSEGKTFEVVFYGNRILIRAFADFEKLSRLHINMIGIAMKLFSICSFTLLRNFKFIHTSFIAEVDIAVRLNV